MRAAVQTAAQTEAVVVRALAESDRSEIERLAGVDSTDAPTAADLLGAEIGGSLVAAISLADGVVIADPFRPTSAAVELLRLRARQLGGAGEPSSPRGRMRRIVAGLSRGHAHAALAGSPPGAGGRLLRL